MSKKILALFCALVLVLSSLPLFASAAAGDPAAADPVSITFNDSDKAEYESSFTTNGNSSIAWANEPGMSHNGDNYALKGTHNAGADYNAANNAIKLTLPEPLAAGGIYTVTYWVYAPQVGNESKGTLTGPGFVLNGDYSGSTGVSKFPTDFGTIGLDQWKQVKVTLPVRTTAITSLDFRFVVNDAQKHPDVWYIDDIEITLDGQQGIEIPEWDLTLDSLHAKYANYFLFGSAIETKQLPETGFSDMYKLHYNVVTAGNEMKPAYLSPSKGIYTYTNADKLVDWANANNIAVHGHTLVWHSQSADWLNTASGAPLPRAEAKANLTDYISHVADHFKNKVISWDVANEVFSDGGSFNGDWKNNLRKDAPWYLAYANGADTAAGESGADYLYDAFVLTRLTDPNAKLYYNDYNETVETKREAIAAMVEDLNSKWAADGRNMEPGRLLIEGIGMQSHYNTNSLSIDKVEDTIVRFKETGAHVSVSELDITVGNYQGRTTPLTKAEEIGQAQLYAQLFELYKKYADSFDRVTLWGTDDPTSWLAAGFPLLFNQSYDAKESYYAVIDPEGYLTRNPLPTPQVVPKANAVAGTPVIDGELDDIWATAPVINANTKPDGQAEQAATAEVKTLWDANFLYVYANVTDSELNNSASNAYEQDSVEVFLSETRHKRESYTNGDGQYRVTYEGNESFKSSSMGDGFESSAKVVGGGYIVEMKIPFRAIVPAAGTVVGFDVQINDASANKPRRLTVWSDLKANGYNTTENWGELTLTAAPAPETAPAAPANLTASALSTSSIKLDWNDAAEPSVTFAVYGGTSASGPFTSVATDIAASEFTNTGLSASMTYYYYVVAAKNGLVSAPSAVVNARTHDVISTGGPIVVSVPSQPSVVTKDGQVAIQPVVKDGIAAAELSSDVLKQAIDQAAVNEAGKKQVIVDVAGQTSVAAYAIELPVAGLQDSGTVISIKTENGTIDVPSNMLSNTDIGNADKVTIRISEASKDGLSETVRQQIGDRPVINLEVLVGGKVIAWSNPSAPVTVSIPYTPTTDELSNPDQIIIWYIDGNGQPTPVPNARYDAKSGAVIFTTTHFSQYAVVSVVKTFDDIQSVPWAKKAIEAMASRGIISGTSATAYEPSASIKRADFLLLLVRALELTGNDKSVTMFSDVDSSAYYYDAVKIASQLGIIQGTGSNLFAPNSKISRQDMMVIVARAMKAAGKAVPSDGTLDAFSDAASVASYAQDSVAALVNAGIVQGSSGKLAPTGSLTRAEAAVILQRVWSK